MALNSGESSPSLRILCPTQWTVRRSSIISILRNYKLLMTTHEKIQDGHDEYAAKASGLVNRMEQFNAYFGLKLWECGIKIYHHSEIPQDELGHPGISGTVGLRYTTIQRCPGITSILLLFKQDYLRKYKNICVSTGLTSYNPLTLI